MSETRWFRHGGMEFEVELDSPAHRNLIAGGAEPVVAPVLVDEDAEIGALTVKELRSLAEARGIDHQGLKKAELVAALEAEDDGDGPDGDGDGDDPDAGDGAPDADTLGGAEDGE